MTGYCCTPDSGDCCGPGSWCCGRAGKHDHEERTMTTNHIDQLAQWWENAEKGTPREGDTYIARFPGRDGYETGVVDSDGLPEGMLPDTRILARAPKPAWHDAVAVIASTDRTERQVWEREGDGTYSGSAGDTADDFELRNVIPLIEAKVTDAMRDRVRDYYRTEHQVELPRGDAWLNDLLTVALGLETA